MEILILSILVLLNGFFALSEIALVSSKPSRLELFRISNKAGTKAALKLLEDSESFLSSIQVGITLIGIVTGAYGGSKIAESVTPFFQGFNLTAAYAPEIALSLSILIITYFSIVMGELVPKMIALSNPEKVAVNIAPIIKTFTSIFYPFVWILSISTTLVNNLLRIKKTSDSMTEAELRHMIRLASNEGIIEKEQNTIHERVFYFSDKKAKHIMTHRMDLEWVDVDDDIDEIIANLNEATHNRIVCCKGTLDNFVGIIFQRDFYKMVKDDAAFDINELLIKPLIIHENTDAQRVLSEIRLNKYHFCFVVNEHGGLEGIITLHNIIENIVGDIPEDTDNYEPDVFVREDNSALVNGDAPIETLVDIIDEFSIDFDEIEYSTVAGFVISLTDKIPEVGDKAYYLGYVIEILDMDGHRIDKILISKV